MNKTVREARKRLRDASEEVVRAGAGRFFKENERVVVHGVRSQTVRAIAKEILAGLREAPKDEIFRIGDELWQSGYMEEGWLACELAYSRRKNFTQSDFGVFERWLGTYVSNWAACDTLCNHTIGTVVEMYPELVRPLKEWTGRDSRWFQRGAAVTLVIPARHGLFLDAIFDIADRLLASDDDLVQKGYGWMLKAASEAHQEAVFNYLLEKKQVMPRTAFRYALEKMPKEWRARAMKRD